MILLHITRLAWILEWGLNDTINVYRAGLQAAFQIYIFSFKFKITHAEMEGKTIVVTLRWGYIECRLVNILPKVATCYIVKPDIKVNFSNTHNSSFNNVSILLIDLAWKCKSKISNIQKKENHSEEDYVENHTLMQTMCLWRLELQFIILALMYRVSPQNASHLTADSSTDFFSFHI